MVTWPEIETVLVWTSTTLILVEAFKGACRPGRSRTAFALLFSAVGILLGIEMMKAGTANVPPDGSYILAILGLPIVAIGASGLIVVGAFALLNAAFISIRSRLASKTGDGS